MENKLKETEKKVASLLDAQKGAKKKAKSPEGAKGDDDQVASPKEKKTSQALKVPEDGDQIASPRGSKKKSSKSSEEAKEDADQLASPRGSKKKLSKSSQEVQEGADKAADKVKEGDDPGKKPKKNKLKETEKKVASLLDAQKGAKKKAKSPEGQGRQ